MVTDYPKEFFFGGAGGGGCWGVGRIRSCRRISG